MAVKIAEAKWVNLLMELGFMVADKWSHKKLQKKATELAKNEAVKSDTVLEDCEDDEIMATLVQVQTALEKGEKIEIVLSPEQKPESVKKEAKVKDKADEEWSEVKDVEDGDSDDAESEIEDQEQEAEADPKPRRKKRRAGKGKGKGKKTKKVKSSDKGKDDGKKKTEKDRFGYRTGTKASRICACLSDELKSMEQLMEQAGLDKQQYGVVNKQCKAGLVVKEDRKYRTA